MPYLIVFSFLFFSCFCNFPVHCSFCTPYLITSVSPPQPSFFPVSKYQVQLQRDCCLDGMKKIPVSYSCERRSDYIVHGAACKEAFLYCCKVMENQQDEWKEDNLKLARGEGRGQGMEGSLMLPCWCSSGANCVILLAHKPC